MWIQLLSLLLLLFELLPMWLLLFPYISDASYLSTPISILHMLNIISLNLFVWYCCTDSWVFDSSIIIAGSAGDRNASQLIVDNWAVTIEYSYKDRDRESYKDRGSGSRHSSDYYHHQQSYSSSQSSSHSSKADWICERCNYQNFACRHECFKCSASIIFLGSNSIGGGSSGSSD